MLCASPTFPARGMLIANQYFFLLLRRLRKIAKTTVGSVRFVCLSVRPSVHLSVCLSSWNKSTLTGRILMIFDTENFSKICQDNSSFIEI